MSPDERQMVFSGLPTPQIPEPDVLGPQSPLWTEQKALLIARYLYYFVLVTRHGTYFDGFAGPQQPERPDMWAAKLVLETRPRWMRYFHLFDADAGQKARLDAMVEAQPTHDRKKREPRRTIRTYHGDVNTELPRALTLYPVRPKEAAFALLDQRTFECHWRTVQTLATHKKAGTKIELFYFLAAGWLDRALHALKDTTVGERWWGPDWPRFKGMHAEVRREVFVRRFKEELGYASAKAWPIYERRGGAGHIMYHMIHATDHPDAPALMARAYRKVGLPAESAEQLRMEWGLAEPSAP